MALDGQEVLLVVGRYNGTYAAVAEQVTTQQIADLGGAGGYLFEAVLTSGTTGTIAHVGTNFLCNSATIGAKTIAIPAPAGTKQIITITDTALTADLYPITPVPVSGTIINAANAVVYTKGGSLTLYDSATLNAWVPQ